MPSPIDIKIYGPEPSWEIRFENDVDRKIAIGKAFNWYNYMSDAEEQHDWLVDYLKFKNYPTETISAIRNLASDQINIGHNEIPGCIGVATGRVARMLTLGAPLDTADVQLLEMAIEHLKTKVRPVRKESGFKPNVQQYIDEQFAKIVDFLEHQCDHVLLEPKSKTVADVATYISSVKNIYCKRIVDHYTPMYNEICAAIDGSDLELKEGYSGYSKRSLAGLKQLIEDIIKNCANKIASDKKIPTVRKKRRRSPIDVVKKLKYKKEDAEYAMISIVASKVVEAQKLVVFNTKYRAVTIYEADSSHGLSVKGTTIIGFDPKKSKTKRLRKPKDFFAKIKDKGIKVVRSTFESVRAVEKPATGRINQDTILYGVYQ